MRKFIIFGIGSYLSDIFDIIHCNDGKVHKIFQNIPEIIADRTISLKERLSFLPYDVQVYDSLVEFKPEPGCEYALGCTVVEKDRLVNHLRAHHTLYFTPLVHQRAHLGSNVVIGEGVLIAPHATVSPNTVLGRFSFINRAASIGHDVHIGEYSRVGPSAAIAAFCKIGCRTSVNIGATVIDRIHIGDNSVVGAGALVTRDLPDNVVAFGTPANIVRDKPLENFNGISF